MKGLFFLALLASLVQGRDFIVDQREKTFIPHKVEARVGDRIIFRNSDGFAHNAFSDHEGNTFDIGMQKPGEEVVIELKAPGVIEVECAIHPNMHLTVIVK